MRKVIGKNKNILFMILLLISISLFAACGNTETEEPTETTTAETAVSTEPTETTKPETSEKTTEKVTEKPTEEPTEEAGNNDEPIYTPPVTEAPKPTEVPKPTEAPKPTEPQTTESKKELEIKMTKQGIIATYGSMDAYYEYIEEVANQKCPHCGDHNCPSFEYHRNALGDIDGCMVDSNKCPAIIAGTAKCPHCGKILTNDWDFAEANSDKYCFGTCYYTIE